MKLNVEYKGTVPYKEALEMQLGAVKAHQEGRGVDTLFLLEHPPVITTGKRTKPEDLLLSEEELARHGCSVVPVSRGGEATYHGPGQIVGYPIINLKHHQRQVKKFVHNLEQVFISLLEKEFGIEAARDEEFPGVWVGKEKITAIGIAITSGVTMHGFAFNVNTDLSHFNWIVPCGIKERGVTSLEKLTGKRYDMREMEETVAAYFTQIYGY